jgi:hypothetical protein
MGGAWLGRWRRRAGWRTRWAYARLRRQPIPARLRVLPHPVRSPLSAWRMRRANRPPRMPNAMPRHLPPHNPGQARRRLVAGRTGAARTRAGRTGTGTPARPTTTGGPMPVSTGKRTTSAPPWHTQIVDALTNAQRTYSPELAMQAVAVMEWLPETQAAIARFYTALGNKSVQMVELPPSTAQFFAQLGAQQQRQEGALRTAMAACKKSVQDRIERILRGRQQDAAWDVDKHKNGAW